MNVSGNENNQNENNQNENNQNENNQNENLKKKRGGYGSGLYLMKQDLYVK